MSADKYRLNYVRGVSRFGLSLEPPVIHFGKNGGYQALNLAVLFGASRIFLLGYDMAKKEGKSHFFGDHPGRLNRSSPYDKFIEAFKTAIPDLDKAGAKVINCTPGSALPWFPICNIRDVL